MAGSPVFVPLTMYRQHLKQEGIKSLAAFDLDRYDHDRKNLKSPLRDHKF